MNSYRKKTNYGVFDTTVAPWGTFNAKTLQKSLALTYYFYSQYFKN